METGRDSNGLKSLNRHALEQIIAESSAGILVADAQKPRLPVVYANPAYERLTGYSAAELTGRPWELLAGEAGAAEELERLRAAVTNGEPCSVDVMERRKDGSVLPSQISVTPLHDGRGELKYVLCLQHAAATEPVAPPATPLAKGGARGVATLSQSRTNARAKATAAERIDPATGLLKFACFQETLRRDLALARYDKRFVTLVVLEVVEFDVYRRTYGGKTADSCQRMIGAQITRTLRRAGDLCARYDDSTLVAAVVGQEPAEIQPCADQIVEHVRQLGLHNPRGTLGRYLTVRATVIGCAPGAYDDPAPAIADALSNAARGAGRGLQAVLA